MHVDLDWANLSGPPPSAVGSSFGNKSNTKKACKESSYCVGELEILSVDAQDATVCRHYIRDALFGLGLVGPNKHCPLPSKLAVALFRHNFPFFTNLCESGLYSDNYIRAVRDTPYTNRKAKV